MNTDPRRVARSRAPGTYAVLAAGSRYFDSRTPAHPAPARRSRGGRWKALITLMACWPCVAAAFTGALPVAVVYSASALADDAMPTADAATPVSTALPAEPPSRKARSFASRGLGIALVELPPDNRVGTPQRPRYILGIRSDRMRTWLNDVGVGARHCYAPMLRGNTRISSDGLRGTLWLYARCAID